MDEDPALMAFGRPGLPVAVFLLFLLIASLIAVALPHGMTWLRWTGGIFGSIVLIAGFLVHAWKELLPGSRARVWDPDYMGDQDPPDGSR